MNNFAQPPKPVFTGMDIDNGGHNPYDFVYPYSDDIPPLPNSPGSRSLFSEIVKPLPKWAYSGFDSVDREDILGYHYRCWATEPTSVVTDDEQRGHVKALIKKYLSGSVKELLGMDIIRKAAFESNEWMPSQVFLESYMVGRERGHMRIFHDPGVPTVKPYRPQLVDERRYIQDPDSFRMAVMRQFRVNPVHVEVFKDMQID